jgi:hypothetical protein
MAAVPSGRSPTPLIKKNPENYVLPFLLFPSDAGHKYVENQFLIRLQNIPSA